MDLDERVPQVRRALGHHAVGAAFAEDVGAEPAGVVAETGDRAAHEGGEDEVLRPDPGSERDRLMPVRRDRAEPVDRGGVLEHLRAQRHALTLPSGPARTVRPCRG